nr:hypothetical protein [Tanacetum cinerariifolium]
MRRKSLMDRVRLMGRSAIDIVAVLGRSGIFLVHALLGRGGIGGGFQLLWVSGVDRGWRSTGLVSMKVPSGPTCKTACPFQTMSSMVSSKASFSLLWSPGLPCFKAMTASPLQKGS